MRTTILLLAASLPLGGCVTMSAAEIGALMDRVNARIVTADELAHGEGLVLPMRGAYERGNRS